MERLANLRSREVGEEDERISPRYFVPLARYEAGQRGSVSVAPEHLLLGLIREGQGT